MRLRRLGSKASLGKKLVSKALVNLNETGIVTDGSGYVTEWTNSGSGGSAYDLDVPVGTLANSTTGTLNGLTTAVSSGGYGLESTAGQTISGATTEFFVGAMTADYSASRNCVDSRSSSLARHLLFTDVTTGYPAMHAGTTLSLSSAIGSGARLWTMGYNGANSSLEVDGVGSTTGDAGSYNFDYGTLFSTFAGTGGWIGSIAQYIVIDRVLTAAEILSVQNYLKAKYAI